MLLSKLGPKTGALETGEQPPGQQDSQGHDHGAVGVLVHLPSDGGEVRSYGGLVHSRAFNAIGEGVHQRRDEGEQVGQDGHRSSDLPVDVLAGDEHAPEPVGDDVHGQTTCIGFFNPLKSFSGSLSSNRVDMVHRRSGDLYV